MIIRASWDDATAQDMRIADLMAKYGIETVFYWPVLPKIANEPRGRESLTEEQMQEIANDFEIGSHTVTHPLLTRIDEEVAEKEIVESKRQLERMFGKPVTKFAYPRGYANPTIQKFVQDAGYESARSTLVGYIHESENPYFEQTTVHVGCDRKEYGGKTWMTYALAMLEEARDTPDSVFHLWGHSYELSAYKNGFELLEDFLKELCNAVK